MFWQLPDYTIFDFRVPNYVADHHMHDKNMDPELNQACRSVTGCLKLTNVEDLYLLSGITSPAIRRDVCDSGETETINQRDPLSFLVRFQLPNA